MRPFGPRPGFCGSNPSQRLANNLPAPLEGCGLAAVDQALQMTDRLMRGFRASLQGQLVPPRKFRRCQRVKGVGEPAQAIAFRVAQSILAAAIENREDFPLESAIAPDRAASEAKKNIAETAHGQTDGGTAEKNRILKHALPLPDGLGRLAFGCSKFMPAGPSFVFDEILACGADATAPGGSYHIWAPWTNSRQTSGPGLGGGSRPEALCPSRPTRFEPGASRRPSKGV